MQIHQSSTAVAEKWNMDEADWDCYSSQNHSAWVLILSISKTIQAGLVLSGILSTGRDAVNDPKGDGFNATLQNAENMSEGKSA